MAKKPTLSTIASGYASNTTLNSNFEELRDAFDNTLSLDGSTPNAMGADLDLNSNNIINATAIMVGGSDVVATTAAALAAANTAQADADAAVVASEASENAAAASAAAALVSETNASTSETNASNSATASADSAVDATNNGAAQVVLAADQVTLATTQAGLATTNGAAQVNLAADQVALATTQAGISTTKAGEAAASASTATTQAGTATTQAGISTTKAGEASTSASNAASSASSAQASKDAALAALDSFDDRYLGQKASDPTVDNDGDALVSGALYFDTTNDVMKVYEGSQWVAAYASLSGAMLSANNLSDVADAAASRTNLGLGTAAITPSTDYATAAQGVLASTSVQASSTTGSAEVPTGTTAQRDGTPAAGYLRFNSTDTSFEGYDGSAWGSIGGGATGGGSDSIFYENSQTVTTSYTVTATTNAMTAGPITINAGATVTVDTGGRWVVV